VQSEIWRSVSVSEKVCAESKSALGEVSSRRCADEVRMMNGRRKERYPRLALSQRFRLSRDGTFHPAILPMRLATAAATGVNNGSSTTIDDPHPAASSNSGLFSSEVYV
jgi:hypothetical protein